MTSLRVLEVMSDWARRMSSWGEVHSAGRSSIPPSETGPDLIFRLRHWPTLPSAMRTADVLRLLSLMSSRPVSRNWMVQYGKVAPKRLDALLERLAAQGALEEINPSLFPREPRVADRRAA